MADWLDSATYDHAEPELPEEPGVNPYGECLAWARGALCGRSECCYCGEYVARDLRVAAKLTYGGKLALARELIRLDGGVDDQITVWDLARAIDLACGAPDVGPVRPAAMAWTEGLLDALTGKPAPSVLADHGYTRDELVAYALGRLSLAVARLAKYRA